jgi:hypothetical protein
MKKIWLFAILASLCVSAIIMVGFASPCPRGCRLDGRRVSDLRQIQNALTIYFDECGVYPGGAPKTGSNPLCQGISKPSQLAGALLNVSDIPKDPVTGVDYSYCYTAGGASYVMQASLEDNSNPALANSLATPPAGCTSTAGAVTCDKTKGQYCVSP